MTANEKYLDYLQMLRQPFQKLVRLRFLQPDGSTAFMLDNRLKGKYAGALISDGNITHNWQNGRRTNASVTISNVDGDFDYKFYHVWFGQEVALDEGMILSDGATEFYIQQGIFLIETPTETVKPNERTVTYNLVDKTAALDGTLGGNLDGTYQVMVGTNIFTPIAALLAEDKGNGYPIDRITPVFTEYYNNKTQELPDGTVASMVLSPYTLTVDGTDGTVWDVASGLAAMVNGWIGYDETGALRIDPSQDDVLDTDKPVEWAFSMAEAELLGMTYSVKNTEVYNDYICVGEAISGGAQPGGRAQILDPRSPVDINAIGRKTIRISQVGFATNTQCEDYAVWQIKRSAVLQRAVTISCSQILHIHGNNLVTLTRNDRPGNPTERHLVLGFSRPLVSTEPMTINAVSVNDFPIATVVRKGMISLVPTQDGVLTYTGDAQSPNWLNYNATELTLGGTTSGTTPGTYTATFTPKAGYVWWDNTSTAKSVTWSIWKASIPVPTVSGTYTYNGDEQTVSFNGYNSTVMTLSGTTSGTNAGSYTATFTLNDTDLSQWDDGTIASKNVTWTIQKAIPSIPVLSPAELTLWFVYASDSFTVTRDGDGAIKASVSKKGLYASVNGNVVKVTTLFTSEGTYEVRVSVAEGTNYKAYDYDGTTKCVVTVT